MGNILYSPSNYDIPFPYVLPATDGTVLHATILVEDSEVYGNVRVGIAALYSMLSCSL